MRQKQVNWSSGAIAQLLQDAGNIPEALALAKNPVHNWEQINPRTRIVQAAIAYNNNLGKHPCLPGVSPLDLAQLDNAISERLPVERVGEAVKVQQARKKRSPKNADLAQSTKKPSIMLHPEIASAAVAKILQSQPTVLILWETEAVRDALINELCRLLALAPTHQDNIYQSDHGSLRILTQDVGVLGELLDVGDFSVLLKTRQERRIELLKERAGLITNSVPQIAGLKGALVEIVKPPFISQSDPKLAWRLGLAQAGYVNQHLHALNDIDADTGVKANRGKIENEERIKRSVVDLLRQWGVLPNLLLNQIEGIESPIWLTYFSILQRNRRTTLQGIAHTGAIMVRVNPLTGEVQATTPTLRKQQGWVSYPTTLLSLISEKWEPTSWFLQTEVEEESREEKVLLTKFVAKCLQDCLHEPIADNVKPLVLFMTEAHNIRRKLPWLQNSALLNLPVNTLPKELAIHIKQEERDRLLLVRLRTADEIEVPTWIAKNSNGSRTSGVFAWQGICNETKRSLYLSLSKLPNSAKYILAKSASRLDSAKNANGVARALEIALIHHPQVEANNLAYFIHHLREQWLYFANAVSLPLPMLFAIKAKEYAVNVKDTRDLESEKSKE